MSPSEEATGRREEKGRKLMGKWIQSFRSRSKKRRVVDFLWWMVRRLSGGGVEEIRLRKEGVVSRWLKNFESDRQKMI